MNNKDNVDSSDEKAKKALDMIANRILQISLNANLPPVQRLRFIKAIIEVWADARVKAVLIEAQTLLSQTDE